MYGRRHWLLTAAALAFTARAHADTRGLRFAAGPHPPGDAPDFVLHVPGALDRTRPVHVVVFLHGFSSCAQALVADAPRACYTEGPTGRAYGLARHHDALGASALLVVPQLAMMARDARAPRYGGRGALDALIGAVAAALGPEVTLGRTLLVAHSAGYRTAADMLADRTRRTAIAGVLLCDALYARAQDFALYVRREAGIVLSLHTHEARTSAGNARLLALLGPRGERVSLGALPPRLMRGRAYVALSPTPHAAIPERHYTELVGALLAAELGRAATDPPRPPRKRRDRGR